MLFNGSKVKSVVLTNFWKSEYDGKGYDFGYNADIEINGEFVTRITAGYNNLETGDMFFTLPLEIQNWAHITLIALRRIRLEIPKETVVTMPMDYNQIRYAREFLTSMGASTESVEGLLHSMMPTVDFRQWSQI